MESQELRIGNNIWRPCCYDEVVEIRENGIIGLGNLRGLISYSEIEPISITEELLTKCGLPNDCAVVYETSDGWFLHVDDESHMTAIAIPIKSLHELQNAYFIATKKELEVRL